MLFQHSNCLDGKLFVKISSIASNEFWSSSMYKIMVYPLHLIRRFYIEYFTPRSEVHGDNPLILTEIAIVLNAILFGFASVIVVAGMGLLIFDIQLLITTILTVIPIFVYYCLAHSRHYLIAKYLVIAHCYVATTFLTILNDTNVFGTAYYIWGTILSVFLLRGRPLIVALLISPLLSLSFIAFHPAYNFLNSFHSLTLVISTSAIAFAVAFTQEFYLETVQQLYEESQNINKSKTLFFSSVAHELRTPLNSSVTLAHSLHDNPKMNMARQVRLSQALLDNAYLLERVVNDILDQSKIESGTMSLYIEDDVDVNQVFDDVAESANMMIAKKDGVEFIAWRENLPALSGDSVRIQNILLNLITNAVKFTNDGCIKMSGVSRDEFIIIEIEDTGIGIPVELQDDIFVPYSKASLTSGLGLSISRHFARLHGGDITFTSDEQGSIFTLTLPIGEGHEK